MKLQLSFPTSYVSINQAFGKNDNPIYAQLGMKGHNGIDFFAPDGTPVMAMHDGTVTYVGLDGSNGNLVVIMTDTMFDYLDGQAYYKSLYGHLKTGTFKVTAGTKVKVGQVIALADNTGASSGSHLHAGVKPVLQGEQPWEWTNLEKNNGYNGAIDFTSMLPPVQEFQTALKLGDTGFEVEKLQAFLIRNKYMQPVSVLGYYGGITAEAVLAFQIKNISSLSWYERYVLKGTRVGEKTLKELNK